jgi:hypothetical protein
MLRRLDDVVQLALRGAEAAGAGERARHVARVAVELATGVDQAELAGVERRRPRHVVEDAGVAAGGDDRRIRRTFGARAAELVQQLGLDLVLGDGRRRVGAKAARAKAHRACVRRGADRRGAAHRVDLAGVLVQPHLGEERREVALHGRRVGALALACPDALEPAVELRRSRGMPKAIQTEGWLASLRDHRVVELGAAAPQSTPSTAGAASGPRRSRPRSRARRPWAGRRGSCGRRPRPPARRRARRSR